MHAMVDMPMCERDINVATVLFNIIWRTIHHSIILHQSYASLYTHNIWYFTLHRSFYLISSTFGYCHLYTAQERDCSCL